MARARWPPGGRPPGVFARPPRPAVAEFVGFGGRLEEPGALRLVRPQDVALDDAAGLRATVTRLVPVEDGVRVELTLHHGRLVALAPAPGPAPGAEVGVPLLGGVTFPR